MAHLLTGSLFTYILVHLHTVTHSLAGSPSLCIDHLLADPLTQITYWLPPPQVDHCRIQLQTQSLLNSLTWLLTDSHSHLFIGISTWVSQSVTTNPTHYLLVHSLAQPVTGLHSHWSALAHSPTGWIYYLLTHITCLLTYPLLLHSFTVSHTCSLFGSLTCWFAYWFVNCLLNCLLIYLINGPLRIMHLVVDSLRCSLITGPTLLAHSLAQTNTG